MKINSPCGTIIDEVGGAGGAAVRATEDATLGASEVSGVVAIGERVVLVVDVEVVALSGNVDVD